MSARVFLITFAIISLLYFGKRVSEVQCQIADYSEQVGAPASQSERWQHLEANTDQTKDQQQQRGLQLILSKLIPSLWPIQPEQSQASSAATPLTATTANQYNQANQQTNADYQQHWQPATGTSSTMSQLGGAADATPPLTPQSAPINPTRQLVSAHSNQLFYPPGELEAPARAPQLQQPQLGQLQLQLQQLPSRHFLTTTSNHYSSYPTQPAHQSAGAWQPTAATAQSIATYRPAASPTYQATDYQNQPDSSWPQTALIPSGGQPAQQQQQQQHSSRPAQILSFLANNKANLSNLIQLLPLIAQTISILPKVLHVHSGSVPSLSATQSSSTADSSQAAASFNELASSASQSVLSLLQSGATNQPAAERLSERLQASSAGSDREPPSSDSNPDSAAAVGAPAPATAPAPAPASASAAPRPSRPNELSPQQQQQQHHHHRDRPNSLSFSQPSVTGSVGSLFGALLPQISRHLLASLIQSTIQGAALESPNNEAADGAKQAPLVSYLLEPAAQQVAGLAPAVLLASSQSHSSQKPSPLSQSGALGWLRALIGSLASSASGRQPLSQGRHDQQQLRPAAASASQLELQQQQPASSGLLARWPLSSIWAASRPTSQTGHNGAKGSPVNWWPTVSQQLRQSS